MSHQKVSKPSLPFWMILSLACLALLPGYSLQDLSWMSNQCYDGKIRCKSCWGRQCLDCVYSQVAGNETSRHCTHKANTISHCMEESLQNGTPRCNRCDNGYFFNSDSKKCILGTIPNCYIYSTRASIGNGQCEACGNNHYLDQFENKCTPVPKSAIIPNCFIHKYTGSRTNSKSLGKSTCVLCNKGYSIDQSTNKCIKECKAGCMACLKGKCKKCDHKRMFFNDKSGNCAYMKAPEGSSNSITEGIKKPSTKGAMLLGFMAAFFLALLGWF